jgi:SPP1 gp7 family putative phage head morphogenesis protein
MRPAAGRLQRAIETQRAALLAHEAPIQAALIAQYQQAAERLHRQAFMLQHKIDGMAEPTLNQVLNLERYKALERQLSVEVGKITALADGRTQEAQAWAVRQSLADVDAMLSGVGVSFNRVPFAAVRELIGATQDGSPLTELFSAIGPDAVGIAQTELAAGLALGQNPVVVARSMAKALNISTLRAQTIARTEMLRAFKSANLQQFNASPDVFNGWTWTASLSPRTCPSCLGMDGRTFPTSVVYFPAHPNCRCVPVGIVKGLPPLSGMRGQAYAESLSPSEQDVLFGPSGAEAFREKRVALADFVGVKEDDRWGTSVYQRSLTDALKGGGSTLGLPGGSAPVDIRSRFDQRPKTAAAS